MMRISFPILVILILILVIRACRVRVVFYLLKEFSASQNAGRPRIDTLSFSDLGHRRTTRQCQGWHWNLRSRKESSTSLRLAHLVLQ